jgi:Rrf2 family protein
MLLNQTSEYALRALVTLAGLSPGETMPARNLAQRTGIPLPYLSKIMRRLVLHRLAQGRKGHGGGFALARAPKAIRFLDVFAALQQDAEPRDCAFGWATCDSRHPCQLHDAWATMKESFLDWAAKTTLADATYVDHRRPSSRGARRKWADNL